MVYIVPVCLQTIVLRSFFNARIAFMVHLFSVFLCSFMAPNMYMYVFIGVVTGIGVRLYVQRDLPPGPVVRERGSDHGVVYPGGDRGDADPESFVHGGDGDDIRVFAHCRGVDAFRPAGDLYLREDFRVGVRYFAVGVDRYEFAALAVAVGKGAGDVPA